MKRLITNADDFGFTRDVNEGIVHAHREGILTSTTLMANGDAFDHAVALARQTPALDIGCHLVLVQGRSLLNGKPLPQTLRSLILALSRRQLDIEAELRLQIERILAAGLRPSHVDSHKHTHIAPVVFRAVARLAHEFSIPYVRLPFDTTLPMQGLISKFKNFYSAIARKNGLRFTDHFIGFRLTGSLNEISLAQALRSLHEGTTEFMCHPGLATPELLSAATRLKESRVRELEALTSPRIRALLNELEVRLHPFSEAAHP